MRIVSKYRARSIAVGSAVAMLAATGVGVTAAQASTSISTVNVTVGNSRITFTGGGATNANGVTTLHAGRYHFHVTTASGDRQFEIVHLRSGYTAQQLHKDLANLFSGSLSTVQRVDRKVELRGGNEETKATPGDTIVALAAGKYLAVDANGSARRQLNVVGSAPSQIGQSYTGTLTSWSYGWDTTGRILGHGWVRFVNHADQPHMMVLQHVKSTTTNAMVRRYLATPSSKSPSFALKEAADGGVLSPNRSQLVKLTLPAGKYLLVCFWPDYFTAMPHAYMGMWKLVTLH